MKRDSPISAKAYTILEKDGIKIAVLGLVTQYIPHWEQPATIKGMRSESIIQTAKKYVPELRKQADLVIVSYHGGFEKDLVTGEATELLTGENEGYELPQEVPGLTLSLLDTNIGKSPPLSMGSLWSSQVIGAAKSAESN